MSGKKWRELYILESSITLGDDVNATTINAYRSEKYLPGPAISFIEKAALEEKEAVIRELLAFAEECSKDAWKDSRIESLQDWVKGRANYLLKKHSKGASDDT